MARYPAIEVPKGWALVQSGDGTWEGYQESNPTRRSKKMTRRTNVLIWIERQVAQDAKQLVRR